MVNFIRRLAAAGGAGVGAAAIVLAVGTIAAAAYDRFYAAVGMAPSAMLDAVELGSVFVLAAMVAHAAFRAAWRATL